MLGICRAERHLMLCKGCNVRAGVVRCFSGSGALCLEFVRFRKLHLCSLNFSIYFFSSKINPIDLPRTPSNDDLAKSARIIRAVSALQLWVAAASQLPSRNENAIQFWTIFGSKFGIKNGNQICAPKCGQPSDLLCGASVVVLLRCVVLHRMIADFFFLWAVSITVCYPPSSPRWRPLAFLKFELAAVLVYCCVVVSFLFVWSRTAILALYERPGIFGCLSVSKTCPSVVRCFLASGS